MPSDNPSLTLPSSETIVAGNTVALSGISYQDNAAAANPGNMYLHVSDSSGLLSATDSAGTVSGSGSTSLTLTGSYPEVVQALDSLTYGAQATAGSDTISFDLWDQYGTETTGSIPVTIGASTGPTTETWTGAVSTDWNTAGNWSGGAVPTSGDTVILPNSAKPGPVLSNAVLSGETIELQQNTGTEAVTFNNVTLDSVLRGSGDVNIGGTLTLGAQGIIAADAAGDTLDLAGTAETIVNNGQVIASNGGLLDLINAATDSTASAGLTNDGSLIASGGTVRLGSGATALPGAGPAWLVTNAGSIGIANAGSLSTNATIAGGSVDFHGTGALDLEQAMPLQDGAQVTGFGQGDQLDLRAGAYGTIAAFANGTLDIDTLNGTLAAAIPMTGSLTLGNFINEPVYSPFAPSIVAYAPDNGFSGVISPDISAPASADVAAGGTLNLGSVALRVDNQGTIDNTATQFLTLIAGAGTLFMNGGTAVNAHELTAAGPVSQLNSDLASLSYVPAAGGSSDTVAIELGQGNQFRRIPIAVGGSVAPTSETWTGAVSSDWNNGGNWSGGVVPASGDTATILPGTPNNASLSNAVLTGETIILNDNTAGAWPVVDFSNVTLGTGTLLEATAPADYGNPNIQLSGSLTIDSGATLAIPGKTGLFVSSPSTASVVNNGLMVIDATPPSPYSVAGVFEANLVNNGTIVANTPQDGGWSFGTVVNNGSIGIVNGRLQAAALVGGTVDFQGPGILDVPDNAISDGAAIAGFGTGDALSGLGVQSVTGAALSFGNGTLDISSNGSLIQQVQMLGSLTLGNFELKSVMSGGGPGAAPVLFLDYAPDGGPANANSTIPDISAPASATVAQGGTLGLGAVSISNAATLSLDISATSGTLYMQGASGSGTSHLTVSATSSSQIDADLSSLSFVAAPGSTSADIKITADDPQAGFGPSETVRTIPVTVTGGGSGSGGGPVLTEPASETVAAGGTVVVSGSYSDSYAQSTPGSMYVEAIAQSGTMDATNAAGQAASGSGTNAIRVTTSNYADINAVLHSLTYVAGGSTGSDSIHLEVWNQAGVMSADNIPVTITAATGGGGGGSSGPTLNEPPAESVAPGASVAVAGSYSDSTAANNPGAMYLGISDSSGTLSATDASGNAVAGSGSTSITVSTDYVDVNAILASLHYTAGAAAGSDTIHFDLWNQDGVETTGTTAVSVGGTANTAMTMADLATAAGGSGPSTGPYGGGTTTTSGSMTPYDTTQQTTMMPLLPGH